VSHRSVSSAFLFAPTSALWKCREEPQLVLRAHWDNIPAPVTIVAQSVDPPGPEGLAVTITPGLCHWGDALLGVPIPHGIAPGDHFTVRLDLTSESLSDSLRIDCTHPQTDWTLFIGPGYHVDPVWWNTQRDYTEVGSRQGESVDTFIELNRRYLDLLETVPDFACTLETVPALHPTWLADPLLRDKIRSFVNSGRLELIGSYNEPQSTLVGCELLCRNIAYGFGFASLVSRRDPSGLAQWDVFGHDPVCPALAKSAGLEWATFCRGLYHGEHVEPEDSLFPTEFRWVGPDGSELLTHYMSRHYTSGWEFSWKSMPDAEIPILDRFERLSLPAPTRNLLLPCYGDFAEPFEGMIKLVEEWNEKYLSPKIHFGTQEHYLSAVTHSCRRDRIWLPPISRDLNPAYSGCNLSFADTKLAQRLGERLTREAEIWSAFAHLLGADFPTAALDRAWRILCYTSHHDAVTGSESDQVYLDLVSLWREARDLSNDVSRRAKLALSSLVGPPKGQSDFTVTVFNSLGRPCSGVVTLDGNSVPFDQACSLIDESGDTSPLEHRGSVLEFTADNVPALGWKSYRVMTDPAALPPSPPKDPNTIENDMLMVRVDPSRGGGIVGIVDKASGREFLRKSCTANDLVVYPEYPGMNMAPWLIQPTGERLLASAQTAQIEREIRRVSQTITTTMEFLGCVVERTITLRRNEPFIDCTASVRGYSDRDHLWRVEFPLDLPGARPVAQTSGGVIGRPFGRLGDYQKEKYFGDWPIDCWGGLECPLTVRIADPKGAKTRTLAVGEIVIPESPDAATQEAVDRLVPILARAGVTTVVTRSGSLNRPRRRAGDWLMDSSRPDFRIAIGENNSFRSEILDKAKPFSSAELESWAFSDDERPCWIDLGVDKSGLDLPVILFPRARASVKKLIDDWDKKIAAPPAVIDVSGPCVIAPGVGKSAEYQPFDAGFAIIVCGTPDLLVLEDGTISLGLFRSSSTAPSGGWVDPNPVRMPDGSYFQHEHWSHRFSYRLMPHLGDWRQAGVHRRAIEFNHPLEAIAHEPQEALLPSSGTFFHIDPGDSFVQALRPLRPHDTLFDWRESDIASQSGILLRLREICGITSRITFSKKSTENAVPTDLLGRTLNEPGSESGRDMTLRPWGLATFSISPRPNQPKPLAGVSFEDGLAPREIRPARYWRSSLGPCGWKAQPVFHEFTDRSLRLGLSDKVTATLRIVNNSRTRIDGISVSIKSPEGTVSNPSAIGPIALQPEEILDFSISLEAVDASVRNGGFLVAILKSPDGTRTQAAIPVNREPDLPAPVKIIIPGAVIVSPDGTDLTLEIQNELRQEVDGFAELILPFEAWELIESHNVRRPLSLAPRSTASVDFPLSNRTRVEPGCYYAIVKWHSCEEQAYSNAFWIVVPDARGEWVRSDQGRFLPFNRSKLGIGFDVYSENPPDHPVRIDKGSSPIPIETTQTIHRIPGGYVLRHSTDIPAKSDIPPSDTPFAITVGERFSSRRFTPVLRMPSGPSFESHPIARPLSPDDPSQIWADLLTPIHLHLTFRPDASAESLTLPAWIGHDNDAFYFMARIPWTMPLNPFRNSRIVSADCLQLAFFPDRLAEVGFAYGCDGPMSWTFTEIMDAPRPRSAPVSIERDAAGTLIRSGIPWNQIYLDQVPAMLPWNVVLHTTGPDGRWKGAWTLCDGTVDRKTSDGSEFGVIFLNQ